LFVEDKGDLVKNVLSIEISVPLDYDFPGNQPIRQTSYGSLNTYVYSVVVADAADYFGVSKLDQDIESGALSLKVDTIFKPIVPASQSSTPLTDFTVNSPRNRLVEVDTDTGNVSMSKTFNTTPGTQMIIGEPIIPGSLTFGSYYDDAEGGICKADGQVIGGIDYISGTIQIGNSGDSASGTTTWTYVPAMVDTQVAATGSIGITESNRGFVYVFACPTLPMPLTMRVAYMSSGKWYQLQDIGNGRLSSASFVDSNGNPIESVDLGTGTINYSTGSVSLSFKYMPDVGSNVLISWCDDIDVFEVQETGPTQTIRPRYETTVSWTQPIPGTVVITSPGLNNIEDTDADGLLYQDSTEIGRVNYQTGKIIFYPVDCPSGDGTFTVTWDEDITDGAEPDKRYNQTYQVNMLAPDEYGDTTFSIDTTGLPAGHVIVPGTFSLEYDYQGTTREYRDDGDGKLFYIGTGEQKGTIDYIAGTGTLNVNVVGYTMEVTQFNFPVASYQRGS
jgi:hypothetical protein